MPKENYTHISIIVDRSGSMSSIAEDMRGGLNAFVQEQREVEGEATFSYMVFDNQFDVIYDFEQLSNVGDLPLEPRGMTAMYDAIGQTLQSTHEKIDEMADSEKPERCIFVIITDGHENASREYTKERVFEMIDSCKEDEEINYEFVFLGANQDALAEGSSYGIRAGTSMTYAATSVGTQTLCDSLSREMKSYRTKGSFEFTDTDRKQAVEEDVSENNTSDNPKNYRDLLGHVTSLGKDK